MSETGYDFAVFGSTPLAHLLAGLLADQHGRKVVHVGESQAGYRLPRGVDLSVAPLTRPESWAILTETTPETLKLIARIAGRGAWSRIDPIFFAEGAQATEALGHIRHMALGFGLAAEPVAPSLLGAGRGGIMLRDAIRINRPVLEAGLDTWLQQAGMRSLRPQKVTIANDGAVEIIAAGAAFAARQAILADDEAIMAWLPLRQWPPLLRRLAFSSILTTPTQSLASALMLELNSGTLLQQQAEGGIAGFGPGGLPAFSAHLQALLGRGRRVEQAGQTSFSALVAADGAACFGRAAGSGADVVAGTGCFGTMLAPALARWIAGKAAPREADWFAARLVDRGGKSAPVDEFAPFLAEPSA